VIIAVVFAIRTDTSYGEMHSTIKTRIESYFDNLPFDSFFKESFYNYLRVTGRGNFNGVTFLNDGRLMFDTLDKSFFYSRADDIIYMSEYLNEKGTPFVYVRVPNKLQDNSLLPRAFSDNIMKENADYFLSILHDNGVDTLDLRVEMEHDGVDMYSAYFLGDHHWKTETSLWAFGKIAGHINREYGFNVDEKTWDPGQFEQTTFERAFLGEESEAVNAFHRYEDFTFLTPRFQTNHSTYEISYDGFEDYLISGSYADVFTPRVLEEHNERILYPALNVLQWYGSFNRYDNIDASEKKNVLFIADSMGWPLGPQFALAFETVDNLYLVPRANYRVWSAIDVNNYDLVVFVLSDFVLALEESESFADDRLYLGRP